MPDHKTVTSTKEAKDKGKMLQLLKEETVGVCATVGTVP